MFDATVSPFIRVGANNLIGAGTRHVTAYFDRTVSLYKGSELRVMGVNIGTITAVVPEGDRVRVSMEYDAEYPVPADAQAVIITPTLTATPSVASASACAAQPPSVRSCWPNQASAASRC